MTIYKYDFDYAAKNKVIGMQELAAATVAGPIGTITVLILEIFKVISVMLGTPLIALSIILMNLFFRSARVRTSAAHSCLINDNGDLYYMTFDQYSDPDAHDKALDEAVIENMFELWKTDRENCPCIVRRLMDRPDPNKRISKVSCINNGNMETIKIPKAFPTYM